MKTITYTMVLVAATFFVYNQVLLNKLSKLKTQNSELIDQYFDLQYEYEHLFDAQILLEEENQILGSMVGELTREEE